MKQITHMDTDQIIKHKFDPNLEADRVVLVGGEKIDIQIDSDKIANSVKEGLALLAKNPIGPSFEGCGCNPIPVEKSVYLDRLVEVEKQVIVPQIEYKTVEVPIIVKEIEIKEMPVIQVQKEIVTVEIPRIVYTEKIKDMPLWHKICIVLQTLAIIGLCLSNLK